MVDEAGLAICKFSRYIHKKRHLRRDVEPKPDGPDDGSDTDTDTDIDPPLPRLEEMLKEEQYGIAAPNKGKLASKPQTAPPVPTALDKHVRGLRVDKVKA